jgi:hypothetical protein
MIVVLVELRTRVEIRRWRSASLAWIEAGNGVLGSRSWRIGDRYAAFDFKFKDVSLCVRFVISYLCLFLLRLPLLFSLLFFLPPSFTRCGSCEESCWTLFSCESEGGRQCFLALVDKDGGFGICWSHSYLLLRLFVSFQ